MLFGNTVKFTQMTLGLVPKVFDAIDVIFTVGKQRGMIDTQMPEAGHIQGIAAGQRITINNRIRHDALF